MLKLLVWMVKTTAFIAIVLLLGQFVQWKGSSVSDQIKGGMAQIEHNSAYLKARNYIHHRNEKGILPLASQKDPIGPSERQKLRALIRELNSTD